MEVFIVVGVIVAVIAFIVYASKGGAKLIKEREEKMARAEKGQAKIIGFGSVGLRGTGDGGKFQAYRFTLEVSNAYKEPYRTKCVWNVFPMGAPKVQEGMEVTVKIDTEDPNIVYPIVSGVEYSWMGAMLNKGN